MARHERQFYRLNAAPFGLSLDATPKDADAVAAIQQFCGQDASNDVKAVTGKHPFELMSDFGEHGDLGMFGGVPAAGTAFRYLALVADLEQDLYTRGIVTQSETEFDVFEA